MSKNITGVISIDDGGSSTCIVSKDKYESFPSVKGYYGERNITSATGKYDYIVDYKGEKYVMGTLAKYDCELPLQMHTDSKMNDFFDLSILVAIHQFGYQSNYLITSVPIRMHNNEEKDGRIQRLKGSHTISVNGQTKTFSITDVKIAPETAVAFWVDEPVGKSRFLDLGSRTIGFATTISEFGDVRFIDSESGTIFGKGLEALGNGYNKKALADFICGRISKFWKSDDKVYIVGGGAYDENLVNNIRRYFPNIEVLSNPHMANAVGMYNLGRIAYNMS